VLAATLYTRARPGADLFRRPTTRRWVDDPAAHHLGGWDRALCRGCRRLLPARDRRQSRRRALRPAGPPAGGGHRPRNHGHAGSLGGRMGVAELEVPAPGPRRGNHLRPLDAHPEAAAGGRCADRHRGLAGRRPHRRWSVVRGGGGWGQRAAQGPGRPGSGASRDRPGRADFAPAARSADARGRQAGRGCPEAGAWREDWRAQATPKTALEGRVAAERQRPDAGKRVPFRTSRTSTAPSSRGGYRASCARRGP